MGSDEKVTIPIERSEQMAGKVVVPWKIQPESSDSVYMNIGGEVKLDDGDKEGEIVIEIPQLPLTNTEEKVTVVLEEPYGVPAKLGKNNSCVMSISHDKGEGIVEMGSN